MMQIEYKDIFLRDYKETDIEDDIRWFTTDTEWLLWDGPWGMEKVLQSFDEAAYRAERCKMLKETDTREELRATFEIETAEGVHIGTVTSYLLDENLRWREKLPGETLLPDVRIAIGIDICEAACWSGGWGTKAFTAFIRYWLSHGYRNLYLDTWSGNRRMIGLARKLGFSECRRETDARTVQGEKFDALTFRLDADAFLRFDADFSSLREMLRYVPDHLWSLEDVSIRPIQDDDDLWFAAVECRLKPGQEDFVNPAGFSIGRAYLAPERNIPCVICKACGQRIGFLVLRQWIGTSEGYNWSYYLDCHYQGQGYGKKAARLAVQILKAANPQMPIKLSVEAANEKAQSLYRSIGFAKLDEMDGDDLVFGL